MALHRCPCSYIYDEAKGCEQCRNPPGTPFRDLPAEWTCPWCGYEKECFRRLEDDSRSSCTTSSKEQT